MALRASGNETGSKLVMKGMSDREEIEHWRNQADLYCLLFGMAISRLEEKHGDMAAYGELCDQAAGRM